MPELSNIQTYVKIEGTNFSPVLERFAKVLNEIDLWNSEIENAFRSFIWDVEENGFVYNFNHIEPKASKFSDIKIRPSIMGLTSSIDSTFKNNWLSCELLIKTDNIRSLNGNNCDFYNPGVYELVSNISKELDNEFQGTGIYFTDEGQDGQDFFALIENNKSNLWQFDYALIPLELKDLYCNVPLNYLVKKREKYIEALRIEVWNKNINELFS